MTRGERRDLNRRAHAIRRAIVRDEWRAARARGEAARYRDYAALDDMSAAELLAAFPDLDPGATVASTSSASTSSASTSSASTSSASKPRTKRAAPPHVRRASEAYRAALAAWESGLETALCGARSLEAGGRPARGERYPDEERDYRDAHPRPRYADFLREEYARMRADREERAA